MGIKDLTGALNWLKNNGSRKITKEEKDWAKEEIDKAETVNDLVSVVFSFIKSTK